MSKRCFDPKECIGALNTVKQGLQWKNCPFDKETILSSLKHCGLPTNNNFWRVFRESGILQEVSRGQFMFTSKDPIVWTKLQEIKTKYQELTRHYANKAPERVEEPKEEIPQSPEAMEQFAIDLLKEKGYQILKPIGILYEEL